MKDIVNRANSNGYLSTIYRIIMAFITTTMVFIDFREGGNPVNAVIENVNYRESTLAIGIVFFSILYFSYKEYDKFLSKPMAIKIMSFLLGFEWMFSESFAIDNTLNYVHGSVELITRAILYTIGASNLIYMLISFFNYAYWKMRLSKGNIGDSSKIISRRQIIRRCCIFFLIFWMIPFTISFPGNMCGDAWSSLNRYWSNNWNMNQPPAYTLLLGILTRLGRTIGNTGVGIYIYIILQALIYVYVCIKAVVVIYDLSLCRCYTIFVALIMGITPFFSNRFSVVMKDCLYSILVLLLMINIILVVTDMNRLLKNRIMVEIFISVIGIVLTRKNGIYIVAPMAIITIWILLKKYKAGEIAKQILVRGGTLCIIPLFVSILINSAIVNTYNVRQGSIGIGETLSLPFQQTARCVLENNESITEYEKNVINKVLDYDLIGEKYNPLISDSVKATYKIDSATREDLISYFIVWGKMFFKYPSSYIKATANQFYMLLYPFFPNDKVYIGFAIGRDELMQNVSELSNLDVKEFFEPSKDILKRYYLLLYHLPVVSVLCQQAIYIIVFFLLLVLGFINKKKEYIYVNIPMIVSFLIIIAGPALQGHPRYAFPIIYTVPVLLAFYIRLTKNCGDKEMN